MSTSLAVSAGCRLKGPSGNQRLAPLTLWPATSTSNNIRIEKISNWPPHCCQ